MSVDEQLKSMQSQLTLLTSQNGELSARLTLQQLQQGAELDRNKLLATREKEAATAEYERDKAKGTLPFAQFHGLRDALKSTAVAGKEGSITVAKGLDGTLLLRAKQPMLEALDQLAACLVGRIPSDGMRCVIVVSGEVESALKCQAWFERLDRLAVTLQDQVTSAHANPAPPFVAPALASVQTAMLALSAVSDAGKFFRIDRQAQLYDSTDEAQRILELLLVARSTPKKPIERLLDTEVNLLSSAEALHNLVARLVETARLAGTLPGPLQSLAAAIVQLRSMIDAIDPVGKPDAFWSAVVGLARAAALKDAQRLELRATGQTVQFSERRAWRSERLMSFGSALAEYRISDSHGLLLSSGVESSNAPAVELWLDGGWQHLELPKRK